MPGLEIDTAYAVEGADADRLGLGRHDDRRGQPALSALLRRAAVRGQPPGDAPPGWRGGAAARDGALLLHLLPRPLARAGGRAAVRAAAVQDVLAKKAPISPDNEAAAKAEATQPLEA